jgi:hypothetical protein
MSHFLPLFPYPNPHTPRSDSQCPISNPSVAINSLADTFEALDRMRILFSIPSPAKRTITSLLVAVSLLGCVESERAFHPTPPPLLSEPIGIQLTRAEPRLAGMPFRVLLDFEQPSDLAFLSPAGGQCSMQMAHTGRASFELAAGKGIGVKLSSLLGSGAFPGKWTLLGGYFKSVSTKNQVAKVTVTYRAPGAAAGVLQRTVDVSPGGWTPVFVDMTTLRGPASGPGLLTFECGPGEWVYCDDVVLMNNDRTLASPTSAAAPATTWNIYEKGFATTIDKPGHFRMSLKTPEAAPDGWAMEEANDLRARFSSSGGRTWTIYIDGRQYQSGAFVGQTVLKEAAAIFTQQHDRPAELSVREEFGRIDRDTPGDRNNDGYNEQRGSYELLARGPRFEVTIRPNTNLLAYPVLEISGLPPGNVLATVEGQLIDKTVRLANGNLLVNVPVTLERATTVNVTVK